MLGEVLDDLERSGEKGPLLWIVVIVYCLLPVAALVVFVALLGEIYRLF